MKLSAIRSWIVPALLLLGASVGILLLWPRDVKPPRIDESELRPTPPVPAIPLSGADRLEIRNRYGEFAFEKRAEGWTMTKPFTARASDKLLTGLVERLGKLEFGIVASRDPKSHEQEKVAGKQAVEVRLGKGSSVVWHLFLGKSAEFTLLRVDGSPEIWQVRGAVRQQFVRDAVGWMEPELLAEPVDRIRTVRYLRPDGSLFAEFSQEKPGELKATDAGRTFHAGRITRSLARLSQLRLHLVEADPVKMKELVKASAGGVEVGFASGRGQRFMFSAGDAADTAVMIEERAAGVDRFQAASHVAIVHTHMLREALLVRPLDLEDPLLYVVKEEAVTALRGQCEKFTYDLVRDERRSFTRKASSEEFALARSSVEGFFRFLSGGLLTAVAVLDSAEVPAGFAPGPSSDFVELDTVVDGKKETVRITWGAMTPIDFAGTRYHYVTSTTRPGRVFQVMEKKIMPICRTKLTWQLKAEDAEYLPSRERLVQ